MSLHLPRSDRAKGTAAVGLGILLLSPDAMFIRLLDMDVATLLFLRGAFNAVGFLVLIRVQAGGWFDRGTWAIGRQGVTAGALIVAGNTFFVLSIRHANAALALVVIASAPVFAAVLTRLFTPEPVPARTWWAAGVVLGGVATIAVSGHGGGTTAGLAAAVAGSMSIAALLVLVRRSGITNPLPWQATGATMTALAAAPLATPQAASTPDLGIAALYAGVMLPVALALVLRGPVYLPAADVSLLLLIETAVGPVWIWAVVGETPTPQAALAAVAILTTATVHAVLTRRAEARAAPAEPQAAAASP